MASRRKPIEPVPPPAPVEADDWTLEDLLTSTTGFGLVTASPLQRAICRVIEGRPLGELGELPEVITAMGGPEAIAYLQAPPEQPLEVYIIGGARVAKTLLAAAILFRAMQKVDMTGLGHGDEPRAPVLSLDKDKASACYLHLTANVRASSVLKGTMVHEGRNELDSPAAWFRHPSGREIQACVTANKAAGNAVVSFFLASVVFDEACKMSGAGEAVVNFAEARENALGRLLPGGQLIAIGSPWAPFGPMYDAKQTRHGKPGVDLVVIHARGRAMNPRWWTPERMAKLPAHILRTEEAAEFHDVEEALFPDTSLSLVMRDATELPRVLGVTYAATMDPATRSNAWTLTIGARIDGKLTVALAMQWLPQIGAPLDPEEVLKKVAVVCLRYGLKTAHTDQYAADAMIALARRHGLLLVEHVWQSKSKRDAFGALALEVANGTADIPDVPDLRDDLKMTKRRVTQEGVTIVLPKRKGSNALERHCDYSPSLAMLADKYLPEVAPKETPLTDVEEAAQRKADLSRPLPKGRHWMGRAKMWKR